jgi:hypothetical protein
VVCMRGSRAAQLARPSSEPVPINIFTPDHSCPLALMARLTTVSVPVNSLSAIQRPRHVPWWMGKLVATPEQLEESLDGPDAPARAREPAK